MPLQGTFIESILAAILRKPSVDVPNAKAEVVAEQIIAEVDKNPNVAVVPVKSAWTSKINITQAVAMLAMVVSYFGIDLDPATQAAVCALIIAATTIVTWVLKTFFTNSVTKSSKG